MLVAGFSLGSTHLCNENFLGGSPHSIKWALNPFEQEIKGNKTVYEGGWGRQLNNLITSSLWCAFTCRSLQTLFAVFLFSDACLVESQAFITPLFSHWFPSHHTTLPSPPSWFSLKFPSDFHPFPPLFPASLSLSVHLFPFFSLTLDLSLCLSSLSSPELLPRAAVPGGAPPVQAAAGSRGRVFLGELPVGPAQPRLGSRWGGAATRWWGHCRGHWEAALPNGGYVCSRWRKKWF